MVVIIDGNQLACRCYFSIDELSNKRGERTETVYGFLVSFKKLIIDYCKNATVLIAWDGGNAKRKTIYPDYKAGRKKFENAFYSQLDRLREILNLLSVKQFHYADVEADDIIGTLTYNYRKLGNKVLIVSSDHDFEQLITKHVEILHPMNNNIIKDINFVLDKYKIMPNRLPEVMAITGDPTDNIPGVEGVGDKTAAKLILANNSLEEMLENVDYLKILNNKGDKVDAKEKLKQKIKSNIDNIKISYKLVKICTDINIKNELKEVIKPDFERVLNIFKTLEFERFIDDFDFWKKTFKC
jgi:DNA polymerase-1